MTNGKQKLELTWIGKDEQPKLEPRILIEDPAKGYGDKNSENMLIYGDNLLALKALEQDFTNKIKCIYIDPPYNTGNAFEQYDDGIEHSIWLSMMKLRMELLSKLISNDGIIWITLDDTEIHYFKILCDEIFGRRCFIGTVVWQHSIQGKNDAKKISLHHNYIIAYSKNENYNLKKLERQEKHNINYSNPDNDPKGLWRSGDVRSPHLRENLKFDIVTPSGKLIKSPNLGWRWCKEKVLDKIKTGEIIFSSDEKRIVRKIYLNKQAGRVVESIWFGEEVGTTREANNEIKGLFGSLSFSTPKPEKLLKRVIELSTDENDFVLDSFLGSGTTAAVAHKMNRKWLGIEMGEHCHTHCIPRLKSVIDGKDKGGITEAVEWKGGGGFKYYYLAPTLVLKDDKGMEIINDQYNPQMLAAAMAKHEGFKHQPDAAIYWKQGKSTEKDYIFTTTQFVTVEFIDKIHSEMQSDESLLICCKSFQKACEDKHSNITIKKIPNILLGRCEFGKNDYSLNIVNMPEGLEYEEEAAPEVEYEEKEENKTKKTKKAPIKKKGKDKKQKGLFD